MTLELLVADLDVDDRQYAEAIATLSPPERRRLAAIHSPLRQRRFAARRWILRRHLANLLDLEPEEVSLRWGRHGKPELHGSALRFNTSHSKQVGLAAFSSTHELGIDVEMIDPRRRWQRLLPKICHPLETKEAEAESRWAGPSAFFCRWVAKEAILKALGCGLTKSPADIRLRQAAYGRLEAELPGITVEIEPAGLLPLPGFIAALARIDRR